MPLKATWKTFSPSYLSPFTSLRRVTLKPNFSQDDIIFSLSVYSRERLFPGRAPLSESPAMSFLWFDSSFFEFFPTCDPSFAACLGLIFEGLFFPRRGFCRASSLKHMTSVFLPSLPAVG